MRKSIPIKADRYSGIQIAEPQNPDQAMSSYQEGDAVPQSVVDKLANMPIPGQQPEPEVPEHYRQYEQQQEPQEYEQEAVESSQEEPHQEQIQERKETPAEINYRVMRQAKKESEERAARLQRDLDIYRNQLEEIQRRGGQVPQQEQPKPKREFKRTRVDDDAIVEGKQYNEMSEELDELRQEVASFKKNSYQMTAEQRLKSEYPDIEKVVTTENIEMLKELHPALARVALGSPDFYDAMTTTYNMIKDKGIYKNPIETEAYMSDRKKAINNNAKPRPLSSIAPQTGTSPIHQANAFANGATPSKEYAKMLQEEMKESTKYH